jgi:hypothetical protein
VERGGWYLLNAKAETVFRKDVEGLWEELVPHAQSLHSCASEVPVGQINGASA